MTRADIDAWHGLKDGCCPRCGRVVESIRRGQLGDSGQVDPLTFLPCGCQPLMKLVAPPEIRDGQRWGR